MEAVQLATYNTSENQELQQKMSGYGFTPKRIKEGKALLEQVRLLDTTQQQHYLGARRYHSRLTKILPPCWSCLRARGHCQDSLPQRTFGARGTENQEAAVQTMGTDTTGDQLLYERHALPSATSAVRSYAEVVATE